jgi:prepilin-type N-terminal cleavage/methylation domain-containing protein
MNPKHKNGFTLLEILIVLFILGMIAALTVPAMGIFDDAARARITRERMECIRRAILGPDDRFDENGRPVIGGYVGDLRAWPDLWEPRAEVKPNFAGTDWETPSALTPGLGQGPDYILDPAFVFFRPFGCFEKSGWRWHRPYRKLYDDPAHNDHIGGLETENEGQPRGLWTRLPEDLPFDLPGHPAPGQDLGDGWKGPYLAPPSADNAADSAHWAESDDDYQALEPAWHTIGAHANSETWEDGDYNPMGELGEHFDDKEAFRLLQTEGRLTDGWGRALRFFITSDPNHAGSTIFWILSEGLDGAGTYPAKGTCGAHVWTVDVADIMATAYDESDSKNRDNIVMKLFSRDWEAIFAAEDQVRTQETEAGLARIRAALMGEAPIGLNTGFTGDLVPWPRLFRWEDNGTPADETDDHWDDRDPADTAYTKGQPRGLWTVAPNTADGTDNLAPSRWGVGWRHAYLAAPPGVGAQNLLTDDWGREILFFHDAANDRLLILSRGADGRFDFGATNPGQTEPVNFTETLDVTGYVPTAALNADNRHVIVARSDRQPGFFRLLGLTVLNAYLGDPTHGTTKACFFRSDSTPVAGVDLLSPAVLTDEDGDLDADDWATGDGTPANPAFNYDDTTAWQVATGARYLVLWNDADGNDAVDSGEDCMSIIYNVTAAAGSGQYDSITADTLDFGPVP